MGIAREKLSETDRRRIAEALFAVTSADDHKGEIHGLCPIHSETNPSFSYSVQKDKYNCFSCGASGDLVALYCQVKGMDPKEGFKAFCLENGIEGDRQVWAHNKSPLNQRVRSLQGTWKMCGKSFRPFRINGSTG